MSNMSTALVWFRRDLRLLDNPALMHALSKFDRVIPLYIHAPDEEAPWVPGAASNWWLHHSLESLQAALRQKGGDLLVMQGQSLQVIEQLVTAFDVRAVFWNRLYEPALIARDSQIKQQLKHLGIECFSHAANLLNEPHTIQNGSGQPYKVFSAYWRNCESSLNFLSAPLAEPSHIPMPALNGVGVSIEALSLLPNLHWYGGLKQSWHPGEDGAWKQCRHFLDEAFGDYKNGRDIPGISGTSRLSPHLHFGEISPRQIVWTTNLNLPESATLEPHRYRFFAELGWREFAYYLLYHFPDSQQHSLDQRFDQGAWVERDMVEEELQRWQRGQTGIPIVDAGMRELWHTGWMHNRVRMIVASLLCKNLGVHWLEGASWFWDTLVDADLASNTLGWQWTAGCGVDAAPYFRIFSPQRQTERFDHHGDYIRHWVPELAAVNSKRLADFQGLDKLASYPAPMLDLSETRTAALARWEVIKNGHQPAADVG